ncbi:hypothetical protein LS77_011365 [Helicobacter bilis]|uniref:Uncharacterized protein n=2 Tax=Helicobacter bilis TaxID=37372 RepID=A0A6D2C5M6_9HELI|nr:hypothetical protein [Helicobacter bilis]EMZ37013.1 hypothetical protein C826_02250 [Helicobacter bilis WiWa]TLE01852.1 hypothetical protein LS77_011365 [Helicobacter bilis]TLE02557.1 hypothetical protein LS76_011235 [Helicobacter bilis]
MDGNEQIKKLRDYAELAWASYGHFHLADKDYGPKGWWNEDKKKLDEFIKNNKRIPTHTDILNIEYKQIFKGDFAPLQAQNFFERYELLIHQPNTESSDFSATFFYNKESKALSIIFF